MLQDFLAVMRNFSRDQAAFDEFARQWYFEVVVPEYELDEVVKKQNGDRWIVTGKIRNIGSAKMPVEIAAATGNERFIDGQLNPEYQDTRVTRIVDADESISFELTCEFDPGHVVVDPDALVLQLNRKNAEYEF